MREEYMLIGFSVLCVVVLLCVFLLRRKKANKNAVEFDIQDKTLVRYHGKSAVVSVPEGIEIIGEGAFRGCNKIREVVLPASVCEICGYAFDKCKRLVRVILSPAVTMLKEATFLDCKALQVLENADGITKIDSSAFYGTAYGVDCEETMFLGKCLYRYCGTDVHYEVPTGTTQIYRGAFNRCKELREVILPDSLRQIGSYAFIACDGLESVTIPAETVLEWLSFSSCKNLRTIEYSGKREGCLQWMDGKHDYTACSQGKPFCGRTAGFEWLLTDEGTVTITKVRSDDESIVIPESIEGYPVVELGYTAFFNNRRVKVVTLPTTIQKIDPDTFMGDDRCIGDKNWTRKAPIPVKLNVILRGKINSYAHRFADEHKMPFEEG